MRSIIFALLFALALSAHGMGLELSAGKTARTHELSYSIGLHGSVWGRAVHFGYANLGTQILNVLVSPAEYADDVAAGDGPPPYYWIPQREDRELYLTADQPLFSASGVTVSLTGGLGLFHPQWQQDLNGSGKEVIPPHANKTKATPILGITAGNGHVDLVVTVQWMPGWGDWEHDIPRSIRENASLRFSF